MKSILFTASFLIFYTFSFGQQIMNDTTFVSANGSILNVNDDLIIGYPSGQAKEFLFINNHTEKKIGFAGKLAGKVASVGSGVGLLGVGIGSLNTVMTGVKIAGAAGTIADVASVSDLLLKGDNPLTGQRFRILRFNKTGNQKRGEHFFAVVAGPGNANYQIELEPALATYEIAGLNNKLFAKP
ncbi:hypothetical protein FA048_12800 [Pedobacter polaris]|uniref:Uncharacterized protein n=1 Tax=Pedobacter polaris TaxID=2571273 RepID=A0A4U1CLF0_9SPHI|nr:hypothetical protein [Pedobacter polaris]TKC08036.1 hypothetical protein FA048_12800 [Pedobacter polaris]